MTVGHFGSSPGRPTELFEHETPHPPWAGPFPIGVFVVFHIAVCWPCARVRAGAVRFGVRVRGPGEAALLLHGWSDACWRRHAPISLSPSLSVLTREVSRVASVRRTKGIIIIGIMILCMCYTVGFASCAVPISRVVGWVQSGLSVVV